MRGVSHPSKRRTLDEERNGLHAPPAEPSSDGTGLRRQQSGHVPTLQRRVDRARVVVLPHEGHRLLGWYAVQVRDASKGISGPSTTARTGDLYPLILSSKPGFASAASAASAAHGGRGAVGNPANGPNAPAKRQVLALRSIGRARSWVPNLPQRVGGVSAASNKSPRGQAQDSRRGGVPAFSHDPQLSPGTSPPSHSIFPIPDRTGFLAGHQDALSAAW